MQPVQSMQAEQATAKLDEKMSWWQSTCRNIIFKVLGNMTQGCVEFIEGKQSHFIGNRNAQLQAQIIVNDMAVYSRFISGGSISAGEAYIDGLWDSNDLTKVIEVFAVCQQQLDAIEAKFSWLSILKNKISHKFNRNSITGSKKNIMAHYDLGNNLYQAFLDPQMQYSSAIYETADATLTDAQRNKLQTICERLDLQPTDHLVEIGTGWGGLAIYAAQHFGCKVTTTTISDAQHDYAQQRIKSLGLNDKITLLKKDYRLLEGKFDKLVSIEMIEAVGDEFHANFFEKCHNLLKDDGKMLIQAITIADQRYDHYKSNVDFIQKHIFPGGCLPSVEVMAKHIRKQTDMVIEQVDDIGLHYAKTLLDWRQNFLNQWSEIAKHNYDNQFKRLWVFYLCYCEGAFLQRIISTVHVVARKPRHMSKNEQKLVNSQGMA